MGCNCNKKKGDKHQPRSPGILSQVFSFGKAISQYVNSGLENVSHKEYSKRLSICSGCEHVNESHDKCLACGCKVTIKAKWAVSKCPHPEGNKWI